MIRWLSVQFVVFPKEGFSGLAPASSTSRCVWQRCGTIPVLHERNEVREASSQRCSSFWPTNTWDEARVSASVHSPSCFCVSQAQYQLNCKPAKSQGSRRSMSSVVCWCRSSTALRKQARSDLLQVSRGHRCRRSSATKSVLVPHSMRPVLSVRIDFNRRDSHVDFIVNCSLLEVFGTLGFRVCCLPLRCGW